LINAGQDHVNQGTIRQMTKITDKKIFTSGHFLTAFLIKFYTIDKILHHRKKFKYFLTTTLYSILVSFFERITTKRTRKMWSEYCFDHCSQSRLTGIRYKHLKFIEE
jgi:hypothetical protein